MFADNYTGGIGTALRDEIRAAELRAERDRAVREREAAAEATEAAGEDAFGAVPDQPGAQLDPSEPAYLCPEFAWGEWSGTLAGYADAYTANRAWGYWSGARGESDTVATIPVPTRPWEGRGALPLRRQWTSNGDVHVTLSHLIEPVRVDDEPETNGLYWAWVRTMENVRYFTAFAQAREGGGGMIPTHNQSSYASVNLGNTARFYKPGRCMTASLRARTTEALERFKQTALAWMSVGDVEHRQAHVEAWAESAKAWLELNDPTADEVLADYSLSSLLSGVFGQQPAPFDFAPGATFNSDGVDDEGFYGTWECDGCSEAIEDCSCTVDVDLTKCVSGTVYTTVNVERRDGNGAGRTEDEINDDAIDCGGTAEWQEPDEWDDDYSDPQIDDATTSW